MTPDVVWDNECLAYLDKSTDGMEETGDQEEGNDDLEEKECPHNEWREDGDEAVHKAGVEAVHAGDVARPEERQNDEKQLVLGVKE